MKMNRLDAASLALAAGQHIKTANQVRQDPAVVKAAQQFGTDVVQAARSGGELVQEARASWRRHSR